MNDSLIMMSEELQDLVPDLQEQSNETSKVVFYYNILDERTESAAILSGLTIKNYPMIEMIIGLNDAIKILKNKDVVIIENIKIMYLENIVSYDGTFKIDTLKIKDINYALKTCVICFETSSKSDKKR